MVSSKSGFRAREELAAGFELSSSVLTFPTLSLLRASRIPGSGFRFPQVHAKHIRIGTAGWSYKDWDGIFYLPGLQRRKQHPLEYLARFFDTTEINTSFYGPL